MPKSPVPTGAVPAKAAPSGAPPTQAAPAGAVSSGAPPTQAVPTGAVSSGALLAQAAPAGAVPSGGPPVQAAPAGVLLTGSVPAAVPLLGELAQPAVIVDPGLPVGELEAIIRVVPGALGVIVTEGGLPHLLDRPYLESVLAGRLGFGRAILHRRPVRAILGQPALVLPAETPWDDAARAALARPSTFKSVPIVVAHAGGGLGIAPVGPLVEYLSGRYATLALRDSLTGLGNRRGLTETDAPHTGALMLADLDRFKEINDWLGHTGGDELLRRVAAALRARYGPDHTFRLGGDEFVVLLDDPCLKPEDQGLQFLRTIQGPYAVAGVPITVEASVGVAVRPAPAVGPKPAAVPLLGGARAQSGLGGLLAAADTAMHAAKRHRTGVELWRPELTTGPATDLRLQADLRAAVGKGQLVLHYQPLVDASSGAIGALEALVRWQHPRRGLLAPDAFLPAAERSDVIIALTDRVLADAIAQTARWHAAGWRVPVAVNLAAPVLAQDRIVTLIADLIAEHGLTPGALVVEVTESAMMTRPERSADRLRALRDLGVRVAMDDFGTGYTSLALLTQLPLDELKLDRTFVSRVHCARERAIVEAVARMAEGLGLTLVAEGVEDQATADLLTATGFHLLQGYHFGRPVPPDQLPVPAPIS